MVEYGNGVGQVAGGVGGGGSGGGVSDMGAAFGQFISQTVDTISTTPPEILLVGAIIVLVGLILFKRAF